MTSLPELLRAVGADAPMEEEGIVRYRHSKNLRLQLPAGTISGVYDSQSRKFVPKGSSRLRDALLQHAQWPAHIAVVVRSPYTTQGGRAWAILCTCSNTVKQGFDCRTTFVIRGTAHDDVVSVTFSSDTCTHTAGALGGRVSGMVSRAMLSEFRMRNTPATVYAHAVHAAATNIGTLNAQRFSRSSHAVRQQLYRERALLRATTNEQSLAARLEAVADKLKGCVHYVCD